MSEITKEMAKELLEILKSTKGFVLDQAPDVAQQLVWWKLVDCLLGVVLVAPLFLVIAYKIYPYMKKQAEADEPVMVFTGLGFIFSSSVGIFTFLVNLNTAIKIIFAPKVFLIEYLAGLIK